MRRVLYYLRRSARNGYKEADFWTNKEPVMTPFTFWKTHHVGDFNASSLSLVVILSLSHGWVSMARVVWQMLWASTKAFDGISTTSSRCHYYYYGHHHLHTRQFWWAASVSPWPEPYKDDKSPLHPFEKRIDILNFQNGNELFVGIQVESRLFKYMCFQLRKLLFAMLS